VGDGRVLLGADECTRRQRVALSTQHRLGVALACGAAHRLGHDEQWVLIDAYQRERDVAQRGERGAEGDGVGSLRGPVTADENAVEGGMWSSCHFGLLRID
jgi:hypothetical protein